jgi:hypothetical protein
MSWSFEFVAENKIAARAYLSGLVLPDCVKEFILLSVDGLNDDGLISIKSDGHLATLDSYQISTQRTTVNRIHVTQIPIPIAE